MNIQLNLTIEQVNTVLGALGELPIKSGAGALVGLIIEQAQPQVPAQEETTKEEQAAE